MGAIAMQTWSLLPVLASYACLENFLCFSRLDKLEINFLIANYSYPISQMLPRVDLSGFGWKVTKEPGYACEMFFIIIYNHCG